MSKTLDLMREAVRLLEEQENQGRKKLADVETGKIITANGNKYKVLDHLANDQTLIISLGKMIDSTEFDEDTPDYSKSDIRDKIDNECLPVFESDFGADNIVEHEVDLITVDMQKDFGKVKYKVRPISFDEARKYNELLVNEDIKGYYWTLTPWSTPKRGWEYSVAVVSPSGGISCNCCNGNYGVRPICILKSNIFVSEE